MHYYCNNIAIWKSAATAANNGLYLLGKAFSLNLLGDSIDIQVPELAHMQQDIMVKHKGLKSGSHHGDLVVKVNIEMPKKLSSKERELVQELQKLGM